jgi:tubulysin polyketide synthase-like protein
MSARALLAELRSRGVELVVDGGRLQYRPISAVTPELLNRLHANKPTLLKLLEWEERKLDKADRLGCVARWSKYPTWIELHDPLTGDWHELKASECLPGVVAEADKHREEGGAA